MLNLNPALLRGIVFLGADSFWGVGERLLSSTGGVHVSGNSALAAVGVLPDIGTLASSIKKTYKIKHSYARYKVLSQKLKTFFSKTAEKYYSTKKIKNL